jgi:hypothetical protein
MRWQKRIRDLHQQRVGVAWIVEGDRHNPEHDGGGRQHEFRQGAAARSFGAARRRGGQRLAETVAISGTHTELLRNSYARHTKTRPDPCAYNAAIR